MAVIRRDNGIPRANERRPPRVVSFTTVIGAPWPGGAERAAAEWADGLEAAGAQVIRVGLARPGSTPYCDGTHSELKVPLPYWPFDQGGRQSRLLWQKLIWHGLDLFNPVALIKVVRLLHRYAPDVVITHNFKGWSLSLFVAVKALRVPLISVLHDYNIVCEKTTMFKDGNCASVCLGCKPRASLATMAWRPDLVVTVSDAMWQLLCSVRPAMGSHLQATLYPEPDSTPNLFARDAPGEQLKVGYLGRIDYTKGVEDLIEASRGLPMEVRIAGPIDTDHARSLVRKYSDLTTVTFLGSQDRDNFLASVGVLVVPSKWREPYGRVAREALNAGCRVIVADHGGLREAAAGFHGVSTYPAGDVPALRECLLRVLVTEGPSTLPHAEVRADSSVGEHLMLMVQTLVEGAQSRRTVRDAFRGKVAGVWSPLDAIASDRTR